MSSNASVAGSNHSSGLKIVRNAGVIAAAVVVIGLLAWQGVTAHGNPDPAAPGISPTAAVVDTGILVFREGLEAILVLAALTASLVRTEEGYWKPVSLGAGLSFLATILTWFVVVGILSDITVSELHIQAATGLLAIVVLLVIMNWFFHRIYWSGWITMHNRRKRRLMESDGITQTSMFRGLVLVGFTSVYREGFEVVLFLQHTRLQSGSAIVLLGAGIGVALTLLVAMLTFVAHYKLPYKRMLVLTGIMIGVVLVVMVGESVQEMQDAHWIRYTTIGFTMPDWLNTWFAVFASAESLIAQAAAIVVVVGSYIVARRVCVRRGNPAIAHADPAEACIVPDCENCSISQSGHHADKVDLQARDVTIKPSDLLIGGK